MMGAQASQEQMEKIKSYLDIGKQEGAELLVGGKTNELDGELESGYYVEPTIFKGDNKMRVFQEEIFGPVLSVATFKDKEEAMEIANDTLYGLGRSEEHTSELQSRGHLVCRLLLEKKNKEDLST